MSSIKKIEINNNEEIFEFNKVAKQANGSVLFKQGDAVILATVTSEYNNAVDEDFIPLTVQYIQKNYSAAKIPGGFIKRDSKPTDFETLTSRIIDRSLRPLFPSGYIYPTVITIMVLSIDKTLDNQVLALKAASAALYSSDLPINRSISAVRIGMIDEELIINPSLNDIKTSTLDLYISGTKEQLLMIEMKSISSYTTQHNTNDIDEDRLLDAISLAQKQLDKDNSLYEENFKDIAKKSIEVKLYDNGVDDKLISYIRDNYSLKIRDAIEIMAKKERTDLLEELSEIIVLDDYSKDNGLNLKRIHSGVHIVKKELVRQMIINDNIRADGRGLKDIRDISIDTNILPSAHSSCLFTRGETQALVIATLGTTKDGQIYEELQTKDSLTENFMVHYNFPAFSVGEAKPIFGVNRRELGHGNLAKRALEPTIKQEFKDTVILTSEILESNGSSSMATVCAGSLALKAAGVPTNSLIAGVAMGAIFQNDKKAILTDITGLEDHDGDIDFKVTGTINGITALQMDIKLGGVSLEFLKTALLDAKDARVHILKIMDNSASDIIASKALPLFTTLQVDKSDIFDIIGKGGLVIRSLIDKFNVSIDINKDSGIVKITGDNQKNIDNCLGEIKSIISSKIDFEKIYNIDDIVSGKVLRITDFGAFIELQEGVEGLLHISKISKARVSNVNDVYKIGDLIDVKILKVSKDRLELSSIEY